MKKSQKKDSLLNRIEIMNGLSRQLERLKGSISGGTSISLADVNNSIADINNIIQGLKKQVAEIDFMRQFEDAPWVIVLNHGQPWYYQVVKSEGINVILSRKGRLKVVNSKEFISNYREATELEVGQHVEYLNLSNMNYIHKPIKMETSQYSINFTGGVFDVQKPTNKKPKDADFFMVTLKQGFGSKAYHETYNIAEKEATRLSKQENKKAYILGVVGVIETVPTTTYEVKKLTF